VIGQFVLCRSAGCDGLPGRRCDRCGSRKLVPFAAPFLPPDSLRCIDCGRVVSGGVDAGWDD
jgi:hypothetical protein